MPVKTLNLKNVGLPSGWDATELTRLALTDGTTYDEMVRDIDEALQDYESVVRANDSLDIVINDLQKLANDNKHKKNPAVYRTLGDALMRHGDLQDALDTYRRALNLL